MQNKSLFSIGGCHKGQKQDRFYFRSFYFFQGGSRDPNIRKLRKNHPVCVRKKSAQGWRFCESDTCNRNQRKNRLKGTIQSRTIVFHEITNCCVLSARFYVYIILISTGVDAIHYLWTNISLKVVRNANICKFNSFLICTQVSCFNSGQFQAINCEMIFTEFCRRQPGVFTKTNRKRQ